MSGVEKWARRYHLERLALDAKRLEDKLDIDEGSPYGAHLEVAILPDGHALNLEDPAISLFMRLLRALNHLSVETPYDVMTNLKFAFHGVGKIKVGSHFHIIDPLFDLRKEPDGWRELDRLIEYVSGTSMSERAQKLQHQHRFSAEDPATEDVARFSIGFRFTSLIADKVAFGSKPEFALSFLDDVLIAAGAENHDRRERGEAWLFDGDRKICVMPFRAKQVTAYFPGGVAQEYHDASTMLYDWSKVDWIVRDTKMMNLLAQAVPEEARSLIKGRYLEDDLGM